MGGAGRRVGRFEMIRNGWFGYGGVGLSRHKVTCQVGDEAWQSMLILDRLDARKKTLPVTELGSVSLSPITGKLRLGDQIRITSW
jgi:hypothetical protein